ncbi:hypothetical protein [Rhodococcus koreensis]
MKIGDRVLVHPEGKSIFDVLTIEDDHALIESIIDAPGKFPFSIPVKFLVPADS